MFAQLLQSFRRGLNRAWWVPLGLSAVANCGGGSGGFEKILGNADAGRGNDSPGIDSGVSYPADDSGEYQIEVPDAGLPDVMAIHQAYDGALANAPGGCKAGHYGGTFTGLYSSYLTVVGVPIPVTGDVSLTLDESSNGEFYSISNGHVNGTADLLFPYYCDVIGTLNCKTKKLERGALRNCVYCVGGVAGTDGGRPTCLGPPGYFNGPFNSDYDSSIHAFVNGTWAGSEETDALAPVDAGGGCKVGPANYGGCGTWSAQSSP